MRGGGRRFYCPFTRPAGCRARDTAETWRARSRSRLTRRAAGGATRGSWIGSDAGVRSVGDAPAA